MRSTTSLLDGLRAQLKPLLDSIGPAEMPWVGPDQVSSRELPRHAGVAVSGAIRKLGEALRNKQVSCVELVTQALQREQQERDRLNAFITVTPEAALARAKQLDDELARGHDRGPFHGIPIAHKDAFPTAGVRTTFGSKPLRDWVPDYDASFVAQLDHAGAISIGKANLHEMCYGITSTNPHFGAVHNPHDVTRIPGGSSGGSAAAVAAGIVPLTTGTDTGGSIRIPASFCGVVGLKATYEAFDRRGCLPLGFTFDHVGPLANTVDDCALLFRTLVRDSPRVGLKGLRIGLAEHAFFDRLDPLVRFSVRQAVQSLAAMGAVVHEVTLPDVDLLGGIGRFVMMAELASIWGGKVTEADVAPDVYAGIDNGSRIEATEYIAAQRARNALSREFRKVWDHVDLLLTPTTPTPAPLIGATQLEIGGVTEEIRVATTRFCRPFNVLGWPALSMPCGSTPQGLPIGVQLVGPPHGEESIFAAAYALETVKPYRIAEKPVGQ